MHSLVSSGARFSLISLLIASLLNLPAMAASEKPLGMVVASQHARLDNANATAGVDVYTGDTLVTDSEGSLRLKLGGSQVYLLSSSSAKLVQQDNKLRASVDRGTLGFSTTTPEQIEIETPLATVRGANDQRVFGQVAMTGADAMTVSAYEGTLLVAAGDQEQLVKPGETYAVSFAPAAAAGSQEPQKATNSSSTQKKVAFVLIASGVLATTGVLVWRHNNQPSVSCSSLPCP